MNENGFARIPDGPPRRRRRSALARVLRSLFMLAVLAGVLLAAVGVWSYAKYTAPGPLTQATIVNIPKNLDRVGVANLLQDKGVISDAMVMTIASLAQGFRGATVKYGEFEFPASASMGDVFNIMASGRVVTYKFTVPEGWTSEMAVARLSEHEAMSGEVAAVPPEGAIIANTYFFPRGTDRQAMLQEMMEAQARLVDEVWAKRPPDSIIKSKEELLTLASIVEKETAKPEERPRVAAVFLNRLKAGMRLQSDPTIIYGLVGGKGKLDRALTRSDIDGDTPYNTYRINGLPPGPIATPGKASLEAVINPAPTADLYFVADGTGGHVFAATLDEHNANVRKWRQIENAPAEAPPGQAAGAATETPSAPAAAEQPPAQQPPQAQLPDVTEEPAAAAPSEPVPLTEAQAAEAKPADAKPEEEKPAEAKPAETPPDAQAAAAEAPQAKPLKPGTMVKVGDDLVPIPALKKKKP